MINNMNHSEYRECRLCPRECGTDRRFHIGFCGCGEKVKAARAGLHFYEEPFLSGTRGSGTVFFSGCSLGCVYCQNGQISREHFGIEIDEERLADILLEQQDVRKAHNINLVTGTHFTPSIVSALQIARRHGLVIPVIWNSSGYEKKETLRCLEGLVDIFLPDFKTLDPELGKRYMNAPDYPDRAKEALACMADMAGEPVWEEGPDGLMKRGLVVRHLVIPGHTKDSRQVLRYLFETYGDRIWISVMSQYTPVGRFAGERGAEYPELCRRVTRTEYEKVVNYAIELGIENCLIQEGDTADDSFIPAFDGSGIASDQNPNN